MSIFTDLTRMWLTRSVKPFIFRNEYDQVLPFEECRDLGLYVHIPFCKQLCGFCPYCKELYSQDKCNRYLDALIREINMVGGQFPGKKRATSLYFGGGTPALAAERLKEVIAALEEHFVITQGIGVELHPDNVTVPVLRTLRDAGVTKLSIGVQSFQEKYQGILGRTAVDRYAMREALAEVPFETVSMDFIFALPSQSFEDLRADIDAAFQCGANHVAIYPFIDFTFTT
ncbi:MAG: radical SAM protein, partial [Acetatifactor sp.]|nr:radical SAM protein [Acetatifactor sp.]